MSQPKSSAGSREPDYKQMVEALRASEERYRSLFSGMAEGFALHEIICNEKGEPCDYRFIDVNPAFERLTGLKRADIAGKTVLEVLPDIEPHWLKTYGEVALTGKPANFENYSAELGKHYEVFAYSPAPRQFAVIFRDITEQRLARQEREITIEFLRIVNGSTGTSALIKAAITFFQQRSGCQAVGVRLRQGDDYPYFEARGFSPEFVEAESSLCARDGNGALILNSAGYPIMECMCGNVIQKRFDPAKPFFTARGSFWTNSTTALLVGTSEADRQSRTRNRCNGEGYESVALIALHVG
jgi:PAS domain S-box-containing protein